MLSDENDCSYKANGQSWRLAQAITDDFAINAAFKGTAVCEENPNDLCCHSCGAGTPANCPTEQATNGQTVGVGCAESRKYEVPSGASSNPDDQINLRCFQQKRRFGVDYLYPVERYSRALSLPAICADSNGLDPTACPNEQKVRNPLFDDLSLADRLAQDPNAQALAPRDPSLIYLVGVVGVPWQDLAVSNDPTERLVYRRSDTEGDQGIRWDWLIGERNPPKGIPEPLNPLMREAIEARSGTVPSTGEAVAPPSAGHLANSINGHEWNIADRSDLQYACIFPLPQPNPCIDPNADLDLRSQGKAVPNCDCTDFGKAPGDPAGLNDFQNPLCQAPSGAYDRTQRYSKAFPSLRQLQVLHDLGPQSVVTSICPKSVTNEADSDYGYRPVIRAMVDRFRSHLSE